jgi:hypothetical protein
VDVCRAADPATGKIIAFAGVEGGTPTPLLIQQNLQQWDALPFDGLVFDLSNSGTLHWWLLDLDKPWSLDELLAGVAIMKTLSFQHLRHNFARLNTSSIRADWFDDRAWVELLRRIGLYAQAARDSGAVGIMLDTEHYADRDRSFWYERQPQHAQHTFAEYNAKARQRGAEFMRAIRQNFPHAHLYLTYGPSLVRQETRTADFSRSSYGLLVGFFDGLLKESKGCTVTDGFEQGYKYRTDDEFAKAADVIRNQTATLSANPRLYRQRAKVGFGVWPAGDEKGLNVADFSKNNHTPAELEYALHYALRYSDGMVWVYGGGINWVDAPKEYLEAHRNARAPHMNVSPGRAGLEADQTIFAPLYAAHAELLDFPRTWQFRTEAQRGWRTVNIREFWPNDYQGSAWYRVEFTVPESWLKNELLLAFGAVDERAWVYLNGQQVFDHAQGQPGDLWDKPFVFDIRSHARPGKNVLTVRVHNSVGPGGIWRGVKLFGPP